MKKNESVTDPLRHVEPQRRKFLAKLIAGGVALPVMTSVAFGQVGGQGKAKGGGKGKGGIGAKGKGAAGKGKGAAGGNGEQRRDPAQLAARWLEEYDKDGDKALNLEELTAALKAFAERRAMQGQAGAAGNGKGSAGKGKGAAGKGKGGAGKGTPPVGGGVRPKKPGE